MEPSEILEELVRICSGFRAHWDGENLFRGGDGSFTACGVFSQFTDFFREHHRSMGEGELRAIAALLARCEAEQSSVDAAYTCFLENIAGEHSDSALAPFLSTASREFIAQWRPHV